MEKRDIIKIMGTLKVAYPHSFRKMSEDDYKVMIELWYRQFLDYDYKTVMMAIDSIISSDTREFYPPIASIKEMIYKLTHQEEMTEYEAWGLIKNALRNSGYHAREEFDKLPPVVQRLVGSPQQLYDWSMMNTETVDSVIASNFMRSYKVRAKHEREMLAIPQSVRNALGIETIAEKMKLLDNKTSNGINDALTYSVQRMIELDIERTRLSMMSIGNITTDELKEIEEFAEEYAISHGFNSVDVMKELVKSLEMGNTKEDIYRSMRIFRMKNGELNSGKQTEDRGV